MGQDTELLMQRIEDIIIKSILATASGIVSGLKQFVKHPETCFGNYLFFWYIGRIRFPISFLCVHNLYDTSGV